MTGLKHRLVEAVNCSQRRRGRSADMLILHYTAMETADAACTWLACEASQVSCHYLIDEAGGIIAMVDEDLRAWHAGEASWAGESDINSCSIGIEIQNAGHAGGLPPFPPGQMTKVIALCRDIVERHSIAPERVLGHSDVAPGRKSDPGEAFDWQSLHEAGVGHWVAPEPVFPGPALAPGDAGPHVRSFQAMLADYGYGVAPSGHYDEPTELVTTAFQRHFRPERIDGRADPSTVETLRRLAKRPGQC